MFQVLASANKCFRPVYVFDNPPPNNKWVGYRLHPGHQIVFALDILAILAMIAITISSERLGISSNVKCWVQGVITLDALILACDVKAHISIFLNPNKLIPSPHYWLEAKDEYLQNANK